MSSVFAALADPTRRAILAQLAKGEASAGDLAAPFSITQPAVSRHLRVLRRAGLVEQRVSAQWRLCRLRPQPLRDASDWIGTYRRFWEGRLDRLADYLERTRPLGGSKP